MYENILKSAYRYARFLNNHTDWRVFVAPLQKQAHANRKYFVFGFYASLSESHTVLLDSFIDMRTNYNILLPRLQELFYKKTENFKVFIKQIYICFAGKQNAFFKKIKRVKIKEDF